MMYDLNRTFLSSLAAVHLDQLDHATNFGRFFLEMYSCVFRWIPTRRRKICCGGTRKIIGSFPKGEPNNNCRGKGLKFWNCGYRMRCNSYHHLMCRFNISIYLPGFSLSPRASIRFQVGPVSVDCIQHWITKKMQWKRSRFVFSSTLVFVWPLSELY